MTVSVQRVSTQDSSHSGIVGSVCLLLTLKTLSSGAHYLMWGGAVSTGQVVREFSSCSLEEINAALGGFPNSCLHDSTMAADLNTLTKPSSSTAATSAPSLIAVTTAATSSSPALTSSTTPTPQFSTL